MRRRQTIEFLIGRRGHRSVGVGRATGVGMTAVQGDEHSALTQKSFEAPSIVKPRFERRPTNSAGVEPDDARSEILLGSFVIALEQPAPPWLGAVGRRLP